MTRTDASPARMAAGRRPDVDGRRCWTVAFEVFPRNKATGRTSDQRPEVTVDARGCILLNAVAYEAIGSPERVTLMADRVDGRVAICWASPDPEADESWPVGSQRRVSCGRFSSWAGLPRSRRWTVTATSDALLFDIEGASLPVTSNRATTWRGEAPC